jgi:nucleoside-triphosphatase
VSKLIAITGRPGVGKTTLLFKVMDLLKGERIKVCGFICPEVRSGGRRIGFKIIDVMTNEQSWLAREGKGNKMVGKYYLNEGAGKIAKDAIERARQECEVIVIDEIGPMEMKIEGVREAINEALNSGKVVLAVVHRSIKGIVTFRRFEVNLNNREHLHEEVFKEIMKLLRQSA